VSDEFGFWLRAARREGADAYRRAVCARHWLAAVDRTRRPSLEQVAEVCQLPVAVVAAELEGAELWRKEVRRGGV
jgi:hypothetical protein